MPWPNILATAPWRSPYFGSLILGIALILGVPLFLYMPPWCDVTLYDLAVRNILRGGIHYRDLFDTNLPGIDWIMLAIRATCGWSYEVLRAWDLLFVGSAIALMHRILRKMGSSRSVRVWLLAGSALFYLFQSEYVHCQRDVWMLLPAMAAFTIRLGTMLKKRPATTRTLVGRAFLEGVLWGIAVWIKPHVIVPGIAVWLLSQALQRKHQTATGRTIILDAIAMILGGAIIGIIGISWLINSGTWPHFWTILTEWNPEYLSNSWHSLPKRILGTFCYFAYWSMWHNIAVPTACIMVWDMMAGVRDNPWHQRFALGRWFYQPYTTTREASIAGLTAMLYLGWTMQALFLQQPIDYVHVPETFLAMLVLSMQRWAYACFSLIWFGMAAVIVGQYGSETKWTNLDDFNMALPALRMTTHPLLDSEKLQGWPRCFTEGSTPQQWDRLGQYTHIQCGTQWEDLSNVADYFRRDDVHAGDYEITCWHDGTHPLYLMLSLEPSTRYMHFGTVYRLRSKAGEISRDVSTSHQRYVVSDLRRMTYSYAESQELGPGNDPTVLPAWFPESQRSQFPWNLPIIYRSGRYLVHRVDMPPDPSTIDVPDFDDLDELGPGLRE